MKYTSLKLSQALKENGFEMESEYMIFDKHDSSGYVKTEDYRKVYPVFSIFPAYDILNDLCLRYVKELFESHDNANRIWKEHGKFNEAVIATFSGGYTKEEVRNKAKEMCANYIAHEILSLLQQNKHQEAEDYILANMKKV